MKIKNTLIILILLVATLPIGRVFAQAPNKMTFQSVVHNASGVLVTGTAVGMQISIMQGSATGTAVYVERQTPTTNINGLASIVIGNGTVVSGSFDAIDWGAGPYFIKAETDPAGGTSYTISGTQQLMSVPYALYAARTGDTSRGTIPTVVTDSVNSVSYTSASIFCHVAAFGGGLILVRGICLSTAPMPDLTNSIVVPGTALGGFTVNATGLIPGTTYYARAFATNINGNAYGSVLTFTTPGVTAPTVTSDAITGISNIAATGGGTVTNDGGSPVTARGVCWNTTGGATIADHTSPSGTGLGHFITTLSSLTPSTNYYARAYATNAVGSSYGAEQAFVTIVFTYATIYTDAVTAVSYNTATSGINVTATGGTTITAQGICWSTSINPTIANPYINTATGTGDYAANLTGLTAGTTYYVRAFCINGTGTVYGAQQTFTTLPLGLPLVTTNSVIGISTTYATSGGNVISDGGSTVSARGVCWSTSGTPTTDSSHTTDGTGTGMYNSSITALIPTTTYFVRAYATNSLGTAYGALISFTTDSVYVVALGLPIVGTAVPTMTTASTATGGGYIISDGGSPVTIRGVCWSTSPMPDTSGLHSSDGAGIGFFTSTLTSLSGCGNVYYSRAYAINSTGIAYGNQQSVSTGLLPAVTTNPATSITTTGATVSGTITTDGGCPITQRGIVWILNPFTPWDSTILTPSLTSGFNHPDSSVGTGINVNLTGLYSNQSYSVRTYITNSIGTTYGALQTFRTGIPSGHYIGEHFGGGVIFYLDSTGSHGMICTYSTIGGDNYWGCDGVLVGGTSTAFGTGQSNTAAIVAAGCSGSGDAANVCVSYVGGGYSDWFLPSRDELIYLVNSIGVYGLVYNEWFPYWSPYYTSSEFDANQDWVGGGGTDGKTYGAATEPVRKF